MLTLSIATTDLEKLPTGVKCRINGQERTVTLDGNYLVYEGNRCRMFSVLPAEPGLVNFCAASDGCGDELHCITLQEGDLRFIPSELEQDWLAMARGAAEVS